MPPGTPQDTMAGTTAARAGSHCLGVDGTGDAAAGADRTVPRVVLDTNVCLDLLLFDDPRCAVLRSALRTSSVQVVSNPSCREEWLRVLRYPQLGLGQARRAELVETFDAMTHPLAGTAPRDGLARLPRCRDPDDQKFIELAASARARWLLSRDQDLLRLGRRTAAVAGFQILAPQQWTGLGPPG